MRAAFRPPVLHGPGALGDSAGSYVMIPAEHPHQATAQGETEVQVHGGGPFEFTYLDPADDPRGQSN